ncbi:MAG: glycosyltransferase [Candidatus Omnitrophota bacterium]
MKKVIIFYISKLSGHFHAANAIEKGLLSISDDIQVEKINALEYTNPILGRIINRAYLEVIKIKPEFWGNIYDNPEVMKRTEKARKTLHKFNEEKMKKLLEKFSPDTIFCTQAFPCGMVADYKRISGKTLSLVGVLTDYAPHSYWLFDEVNFYVTPSEETKQVLINKGVKESKVKVYGIPVDPKFEVKKDKASLKKEMGLTEDHPVIFIMGGNQGLGEIEESVKLMLSEDKHFYQLIVVTGSNKKLYSKLRKIEKRKPGGTIKVLPFADNVDEIMEVSDVIVTKAGGLTVAEALEKNLPMIIVSPIPGHERMNTDYLVSKGAAIEIKEQKDLYKDLDRLFDDREFLKIMKKKTEQLAKTSSALNIARLAFEKTD